ncbi:hypothetical protein PhCBS80983_g05101 [Powellomyces hirtus]|uniref:Histidine kinase n=1 Tax=Powellomyces hirtus TaxID=109895 RepID=A0A507DVD9_9FUNG|nr:hypothetical protein PhCBS80983_g05101 [Powellomyces hirtus]
MEHRACIDPNELFIQATSQGGTISNSRAEVDVNLWVRILRMLDPRRSIKSRLSMALFCVSIIFLTTSALIVGTVVDRDLKGFSGRSLVQLATTAATQMHDDLYSRYRDLAIISTLPFVMDSATPASALQTILDRTANTYEFYSWIGIAYNNGTVKAATKGLLLGKQVQGRPWFIGCVNATPSQPPYIGDVHGAVLLQSALNLTEPLRLLDVALPLYDANNVQYGVIGAHMNVSLTQNIANNVLGYLKDKIQVDLFIVGGDVLQGPVNETGVGWIPSQPGSALDLATRGRTGYRDERWPSGEDYLTAYTRSPTDFEINIGFSILVRQKVSEAYATSHRLIVILTLVHIGFAVIFVGASYSVAHITTAPLVAISRAADNIRKRSAMPHIPVVNGNDEIALLSRSLSSLVSTLVEKEINLKGINEDLADKVDAVERAQAELRASEENFRQLADTTESAFFIVDFALEDDPYQDRPFIPNTHNSLERMAGESWTFTNSTLVKVFGVTPEELKEDHTAWFKAIDSADLERLHEEFATRRLRPLDVTFRINPGSLAKSGGQRHINLKSLPVKSSTQPDKVKRIIGVFQDVTRQMTAEMESSNKSSWVRQVGHEIRNPLSATFTMINLLLETQLTEEQVDLLQTIRMSNDTLLSLINSILDLAKLEAGEMSLETMPFNLVTQVEDVLDLMAPQAHNKKIRIGAFVNPAVDVWLKGDPLRLRQILINLCTNALKFTKTGSVHLDVNKNVAPKTEMDEEEGHRRVGLRFRLTDTGIGISQSNQNKLFKEFAQAEESTSRQYGGTGLGLSIVKRLVQMMNGDVGIESEVGKGSTFFFTVVFLAQTSAEIAEHPIKPIPQIGPRRVLSISAWSKMHEMVRHTVQLMGVTSTVECPDAALALNIIEQRSFDIAVMDVDVVTDPVGSKAFETISKKMPVAIITSREQRDSIRSKLVPGGVGAVTDPVKMQKLQNEINALLTSQTTVMPARSWSIRKLVDNDPLEKIDGETIKVMLVEDNLINQKAVGKLLTKLTTVAPLIAGDGQICLDMLSKMKTEGSALPDVIFMDVCMPVMDGLTATRIINEIYPSRERPVVIIMTANALHEDYMQCMQSGADGYLLKPASKEVLKKTMASWWAVARDRRSGKDSDHRSFTSLHLEDNEEEIVWDEGS